MRVSAVEAARRALKFHIQSTVTLGSERDTNNVASIGDGKPGEFRVSEDRTAFWLDDNVRQLTGAVEHEHKPRPAVLRKRERFTVTG